MQLLFFSFISLVLVLLALLFCAGLRLSKQRRLEAEAMERQTVMSWPRVALIVPVAGNDPRIRPALTSLLTQNYPSCTPVFVTEHAEEPAATIIRSLKETYPSIVHVVAGQAESYGQKNHNLLQGIAAVATIRPDCYVFCDSTHIAPSDFLFSLIHPIAVQETSFSTGYHEIVPKDTGFVSLAYTASVLIMRLLQALSVFTQPWGGAMAMRRQFFEEMDIAGLWRKTVVDDCALVPLLQAKKRRVRLVARALLATECHEHKKSVWEAWMERQILFPKFCVPIQWVLLGVMLMLFLMPPFLVLEEAGFALFHGVFKGLWLAVAWFLAFFGLILALRRFLPVQVPPLRWIGAFLLALLTFLREYIATIGARGICWHGYVYTVDRGGIVRSKKPLRGTKTIV